MMGIFGYSGWWWYQFSKAKKEGLDMDKWLDQMAVPMTVSHSTGSQSKKSGNDKSVHWTELVKSGPSASSSSSS